MWHSFLPLGTKQNFKKAEGSSGALYLVHTVAAKDNFYSIGRLYNVSPKDQLAPFNKLSLEKSLNPGQQLKIPLAAGNFLQSGKAAADESLIPVYHIIADKEGLYRVSINHNKVPIASIKEWNHLKMNR
jgi:LysM repeat protein